MKLIPNWQQAHKFLCIWAALVILALNIAAIALPVLSAHITPTQLALINVGLAAAIPFLRVLQQQGLISEKDVPGLSAITGITQTITTVGDVSVTQTKIETDAAAAPSAATTATPQKDAP